MPKKIIVNEQNLDEFGFTEPSAELVADTIKAVIMSPPFCALVNDIQEFNAAAAETDLDRGSILAATINATVYAAIGVLTDTDQSPTVRHFTSVQTIQRFDGIARQMQAQFGIPMGYEDEPLATVEAQA